MQSINLEAWGRCHCLTLIDVLSMTLEAGGGLLSGNGLVRVQLVQFSQCSMTR